MTSLSISSRKFSQKKNRRKCRLRRLWVEFILPVPPIGGLFVTMNAVRFRIRLYIWKKKRKSVGLKTVINGERDRKKDNIMSESFTRETNWSLWARRRHAPVVQKSPPSTSRAQRTRNSHITKASISFPYYRHPTILQVYKWGARATLLRCFPARWEWS